ncbi:MAG: RimK-like ATPgrasp N-terminal domain-containing protein [Deinococcales bacterium]
MPFFSLSEASLSAFPWAKNKVFNLQGDYSYLSQGYYDSLDMEFSAPVHPSTAEILDAYVVPIALEKAKRGGLAVPEAIISNDRLLTPSLAYPINPFSSRFELVLDTNSLQSKLNTLTRTGKYAFMTQKLPEVYRIDLIKVILGRCEIEEYQAFAQQVFSIFHLPLMKVRVIVTPQEYLFSAIEPLAYKNLTKLERQLLEGLGTWQG